jgi:hypothetical protein
LSASESCSTSCGLDAVDAKILGSEIWWTSFDRGPLGHRGGRTAAWGSICGTAKHDPALTLGDRAAFLDPDTVACAKAIVLVVLRIFLGIRDELLVDGVYHAALHPNDHRLVTGITDDDTLEDTFRHHIFP